ncbi:unnamed protein product [Bathycoccus prasinos]
MARFHALDLSRTSLSAGSFKNAQSASRSSQISSPYLILNPQASGTKIFVDGAFHALDLSRTSLSAGSFKNAQSASRSSQISSPYLILNPQASGTKSTSFSTNVASRFANVSRTSSSQKHEALSISETAKQHPGKLAGFGFPFPTSQS